jgi:hypothetical protein
MAGQEFPSSIDRCLLTSAAAALTAASESAEAANHDFPPPSPEVQASNVSVQQRVAFWKSGSQFNAPKAVHGSVGCCVAPPRVLNRSSLVGSGLF